jgi:hypothetical protein
MVRIRYSPIKSRLILRAKLCGGLLNGRFPQHFDHLNKLNGSAKTEVYLATSLSADTFVCT